MAKSEALEKFWAQHHIEIELFGQAIQGVKSSPPTPEKEVTGLLAMVGHSYNGELMVVGKAVNGDIAGAKCSVPELDDRFIEDCVCCSAFGPTRNQQRCPMLWVTDQWGEERARHLWDHEEWPGKPYSTQRSAFWRGIKGILPRLAIGDVEGDSWPSHLVWTNLYKVAPAEGGNPSTPLCAAQFDCCVELLKSEIQFYRPKRVLFSTGLDWAKPFLTKLGATLEGPPPRTELRFIKAIGAFRNLCEPAPQVVVASHPERKPQEAWINNVVTAFGAMH
ncbi:MAG TPA: hypothetical protein VJN94_08695 [Candidatus Binataceae bacterium]|nr:hypothetical protein [Candidatus Binataceae bacterium]